MSHAVETMAFANEVPWHGLGKRVDTNVSVEEMTIAAGLNWSVNAHPVFARINGDEVELNQRAYVRSSDNKILTIASDRWKPLQNDQAMQFFYDYTQEGGITLETAGSLRGGRIVWGLANLGKGYLASVGDQVQGYLLMISPHEVGKSIQLRMTSVRVVCANTMAMALREGGHAYRQTHIGDFKVPEAKAAVSLAIDQFMDGEAIAKKLLKLKLSTPDTVRILAPHFQPGLDKPDDMNLKFKQVMEPIANAPGAVPNTGWGVLNGVMHWADHVAGKLPDARLTRSWLGRTGRVKEKVQSTLLQLA